ncbi:MAG TPA: efflux RND transporter periplasmic adaptor subunit [Candidatus Hydrogenedentes bacterium]|nr:efflux RND transporter periplasmic adaptor subunit [Candidatus Hydrogenedentota bacterium]
MSKDTLVNSSLFRVTKLPLGLAMLGALALAGCNVQFGFGPNGKFGDLAKNESAPLVIPVEAVAPERGDISTYFETSTRVEAERRVDVASKGSARCVKILADEGDTVEQGDILAELDQAEAQAQYDQSSIQVKQNETAYLLSKRQFDEGLGTQMDMDNNFFAHEQSLATLKSQKLLLDNLTIRAPIGGVITSRQIHEGMLVGSGDIVFNIVDPTSFMLAIAPPEKELSRLKIGQQAEVRIDALPGRVYKAKIRRINPSVDPVTGTIKVILDFDDELRDKLRESAFSRVKLVMSTRKNVVLIPKEAIVEESGKKYVFIVERSEDETVSLATDSDKDEKDDGSISTTEVEASVESEKDPAKAVEEIPVYTAKRVEVQTALEDSDRIQVFSGVTDLDLMVINGQHSLKDGAKVRLTNVQTELLSKSGLSADELLDAAKEKRKEGGNENSSKDQGRRGRGKF